MPEHLVGIRWAIIEIIKGETPGALLNEWNAQLDDLKRFQPPISWRQIFDASA
jgi:hypothetical protein